MLRDVRFCRREGKHFLVDDLAVLRQCLALPGGKYATTFCIMSARALSSDATVEHQPGASEGASIRRIRDRHHHKTIDQPPAVRAGASRLYASAHVADAVRCSWTFFIAIM
jgi:hypothetical protein